MRRILVPVLLLLAAASPAGAAQRAVDFDQRVPAARFEAPARASAASMLHVTAPLATPRRFDLLGVRWHGGAHAVELRVRRAGGRWSRWAHADPGEPVWSGAARAYQLRLSGAPRDVRVHFVALSGRPQLPRARAASGAAPALVPRSAWDPQHQCTPRVTPAYGRVDFALVHHTVSLNSYGPSSAPGIVLAICRFHRNGNGWNDIGYNLLVDRFGTLYEGRAGGVQEPVMGAHAQGWNSTATGIAAIGDFSSAGLPSAPLHTLARAIAWKLSLAGVPATGEIGEVSIGGELNRFAEGVHVRFQRVSGHRDGGQTECPGAALYAQLPVLRVLVQQAMPAPRALLTISPSPLAQPAGGPVLLTGRLARADGTRPSGVPLTLQQRQAGAWVDVGSVRSGGDGIWSAALALAQDGAVRALEPVSGLASPAVAIVVRASVRAQLSAPTLRSGQPLTLNGTTTPAKVRVRVSVERKLPSGRFRRVQLRALATSDGAFAAPLTLAAPGVYRVIVRTPTDALNAAGASRAVPVRVLARRR